MKKFFLFAIISAIICFPGIFLYLSFKKALLLNQEDKLLTLKNNIELAFQKIDKETHPGEKIHSILTVFGKENADQLYQKTITPIQILHEKVPEFTKKLLENYNLNAELIFIARNKDKYEFSRLGKNLGMKVIIPSLVKILSKYTKGKSYKEELKELKSVIANDLKAFYPIKSLFPPDPKSEKVYLRQKDSLKMLTNFYWYDKFFVIGLFDLTNFDDLKLLNGNVRYWDSDKMGLTFAASNSKFSQGSSFFDDKQWLLKKIRNKIQNVPTDLTFFEIDNFLVAIDKKATATEFRSILAIQTDSSKISLNSQIILAIIGLLTCLLIKIFAEKIFLGRGPDVSLKQMVATTFLILILIPLSSSVFLSHLFVSNQLKKERILNKEKLFNKVNNLDKQTEFSLKETLDLIRSLNSIEKIASFTGLSPDNSFYELSLAFGVVYKKWTPE